MNVKFLNLQKQQKKIKKRLMSEISNIIDKGAFVAGEKVKQFEENFSNYCGSKYCVATSSGTTALHVALSCYDVAGEVITAPNSFIATSEAVSYCPNLKHKFVDVDSTSNIVFQKTLSSVTKKTKILLPVSLYGNPCDLFSLKTLSKTQNLILIHDAAQAHGALCGDKNISDYADLTCYSFYPGKNLGTSGEGGAVTTNSRRLYELMKCLINHGQSRKYHHALVGFNYRMSEIEAATLDIKLDYIEEWTEKRIRAAHRYKTNLAENKKIKFLRVKEGDRCVYHLFPIFIKNRNKIQEELKKEGIETALHYPKPIHLQRAYKNLKYQKGDFPVAEMQAASELSLPIYPEITQREIDYVCKKLNKIL